MVRGVLEGLNVPHAVIQCVECITGRHLLERTIAACLQSLHNSGQDVDAKLYSKCENISALAAHLQRMIAGLDKFVLVFDGIDEQRDAPPTLLPAMSRFGELVFLPSSYRQHTTNTSKLPNLTVVFILTTPSPRLFHAQGIPHVHFPAYRAAEAVHIVSRSPLPLTDHDCDPIPSEHAQLYTRYLGALHSSLSGGLCDIIAFRTLAEKLWPAFIAPVLDGSIPMQDFAKLMLANRLLFQSEEPLIERLAPPTSEEAQMEPPLSSELPYLSKFLLCAAYLASYNPPRTDPTFFMHYTERKRRKRNPGVVLGKPPKNRKILRRLLAPAPFSVERMMAIFHAIVPHKVIPTADLYTQIATLVSIRLLTRSGIGSTEGLDPSARLKVNVSEDFIVSLARTVNFEIRDMFAEA